MLKHLYFCAYSGVPHEPVSITPDAAFFIGFAFAQNLAAKTGKAPRVAVGRDCRMRYGKQGKEHACAMGRFKSFHVPLLCL